MKVKELIELLSGCDQEADALVHGYEGGYEDVTILKSCRVAVDYYDKKSHWYYGPHELDNDACDDASEGLLRKAAVIIQR